MMWKQLSFKMVPRERTSSAVAEQHLRYYLVGMAAAGTGQIAATHQYGMQR
jgi:hypothetical protein